MLYLIAAEFDVDSMIVYDPELIEEEFEEVEFYSEVGSIENVEAYEPEAGAYDPEIGSIENLVVYEAEADISDSEDSHGEWDEVSDDDLEGMFSPLIMKSVNSHSLW